MPVVVIGAGHCGLSASYWLAHHGIEHVVLERGQVAESWRSERWDSLRLLTPNWQSQLPGHAYPGDDPDGFMTMPEIVEFISDYARTIAAPVREGVCVTRVARDDTSYRVETDAGVFRCLGVVLANGACNLPNVPKLAAELPASVSGVTSFEYKNPGQLPPGPVLVVGASATGLQLADEIQATGRPVTLSVGEHVRMPRTYRGRDIQWWMQETGLLDDGLDAVDDLVRARNIPSPQLIGTVDRSTLDLNTLVARGVTLVGRLAGIRPEGETAIAQFSGSLKNVCALADLKLNRLLNTFDEWAQEQGVTGLDRPERFDATDVPEKPALGSELGSANGIRSILWATGYRPDYSWLDLPVLDRKGKLKHEGGVVTDAPGVYALGLTFLRRRKSSFIHGADDDARDLVDHLSAYLRGI